LQLVQMQPLIDVIKLTLQTGYIKHRETPVNLLLIAKPESAKTSAMAMFKIKGTHTTNNITQAVLVSKILPMIENGGLKHLIIPDFLNAIEKDYTTRKGFLNLTKTLIEEGVTSLDTFHMRTLKVYNPPIQCGLITGITTESFHGQEYDRHQKRWKGGVRSNWKRTGLLSRFIPFSYQYELSKIFAVFEFIEKEERGKSILKQTVKRRMIDVKGNAELFQKLQVLSMKIGEKTGGYGFRMQRNLQVLAKANAVLYGRSMVVQEDVDKVVHLGNWMNFDNNPL